jgi:hypothetical protein
MTEVEELRRDFQTSRRFARTQAAITGCAIYGWPSLADALSRA